MTNNRTYTLATKHNATGAIVHLDVAPMTMSQAVKHRDQLSKLMPNAPVYVINLSAE